MPSYNLNRKVRLTGAFWRPGQEDQKICGELVTRKGKHFFEEAASFRTGSQSDGGAFVARFNSREIVSVETLLGVTSERKCTLLGLQEIEDRGVYNASENYVIEGQNWRVSAILAGMHVTGWEDKCLDRFHLYLSGLESWMQAPWSHTYSEDAVIYELPRELTTLFRFTSLALKAEVAFQTMMISRHSSLRIKTRPVFRLDFTPQVPCSLDTVLDLVPRVESFFTLLLGTSVAVDKVSVNHGREEGTVISRTRLRKEKAHVQRWVRCQPDQLALALARWLAVPDDEQPVEKIVLGLLRLSRLYTETEFLSLAQSLEAFGRLRFKEPLITESDFREGLQVLKPEMERTWKSAEFVQRVLVSLKHLNEPTYAERIRLTTGMLGEPLRNSLLGDAEVFSRKVRQTRNFFTHPGTLRGGSVVEGKALFLLNKRMHSLLRAVMLIDLGIPESQLKDAVLYEAKRWF